MADELALRRLLEIAAVWGNTNMDTEEQPNLRTDFQKNIDDNYISVIEALYGGVRPSEEDEPDTDHPFWQAMERGLEQKKLPEPKIGE